MFTEDSFDLSHFAVTTPVQTVVPLDEPDQIRPTTATDETTITLNSPVHLLPNHLDFDHLGLIEFDRGTGRLELIVGARFILHCHGSFAHFADAHLCSLQTMDLTVR